MKSLTIAISTYLLFGQGLESEVNKGCDFPGVKVLSMQRYKCIGNRPPPGIFALQAIPRKLCRFWKLWWVWSTSKLNMLVIFAMSRFPGSWYLLSATIKALPSIHLLKQLNNGVFVLRPLHDVSVLKLWEALFKQNCPCKVFQSSIHTELQLKSIAVEYL